MIAHEGLDRRDMSLLALGCETCRLRVLKGLLAVATESGAAALGADTSPTRRRQRRPQIRPPSRTVKKRPKRQPGVRVTS
ncbi:hypothetical protein [Pararhodobacter sp. SW119]|uniref:hypothetical protein n=1 Tax=Pararhodobacter sp. SW119 TaxID=2780075 RepID=UPI001ADF3124|nr:hypothetical protein [Pararhodobacter sp. SW119]